MFYELVNKPMVGISIPKMPRTLPRAEHKKQILQFCADGEQLSEVTWETELQEGPVGAGKELPSRTMILRLLSATTLLYSSSCCNPRPKLIFIATS